jgi:hypothetical protein
MAIGTTNLDHPHDHVCPPEGTMNAVVNAVREHRAHAPVWATSVPSGCSAM